MSVVLSPVGGVAAQFFTNSGAVLTGGKIYTYAAGTSTPEPTYTTASGTIAWTNPIVLDAAGRVPDGGEIWLTDGVAYKFVLKTSNDVLIATYDNISGINSNFVNFTNDQEIQVATAGQTVFTLTTMAYLPGTHSLSVFVDGVNQYGPGASYAYEETDSTTVTFTSGLHVGAEVKFSTTQLQGAGAIDASQVAYDPPFTGSVATNVEAKLAQTVSVQDFGAVGNGITDDSAAFQAAHDALGPDGGEILIPAVSSYYLIDTSIIFTKPIRLVGDGWFNSELLTRTNNVTLISTNSKLDVVNLHFTALSAARGTCKFILHRPASANHGHSTIDNCFFDGALNCYHSQSTNAIVLNNSVFGAEGLSGVAILLENLTNPDAGDSFITNNTISGASTVIGIQVNSTSGINICNNKFNNELAHILVSAGANLMGNYLISNNSFEGHTDYAVKIIATSGTITKTLFTGNQFSADSTAHIVLSNGAKNTTITGNTFNHVNAALGTGVVIEAGVENVTITGNAFHQIANGIITASGATASAGITASGNRFANDVTTFFAGDDGQSNYAPQRELSYSQFISNASDTVYADVCKVIGYGTVKIKVYGVVQGVGACNYYAEYLISGSTPTQIIAPVTTGASFDVQVAAAGGYLVVSAKRATGIGTTLTAFVEVTTNGQITNFRKA